MTPATSTKPKATKLFDSGFSNWTPDRLPDLGGKTYLITGGNSGIGFEAAKMLASVNGNLIIACRNPDKAKQAIATLEPLGTGTVDSVQLDLASLAAVRSAAEIVRQNYDQLDGLINNAGIMQTPETRTEDGFELQFATNHLGHFLLTGLLFDLVENAAGRIVTVSSIAHKFGQMNFDDLMFTQNYNSSRVYGQSKLANLLFTFELDRKLKAIASQVSCYACHPGYSDTQLQSTGPKGLWNLFYKFTNQFIAQPAYNGAIPTVLAAAGVEAKPGAYYGPQDLMDCRGRVSDAIVMPQALDEAAAARLWQESEKLVGYTWELGTK